MEHGLVAALWGGDVPIALFDAGCRFVRVNRALAALNGLAPEAHVGRSLGEVLGLEPRDPRRDAVARVEEVVRGVVESGQARLNVPIEQAPEGDPARGWICSYLPVRADEGEARVCVLVTDLGLAREREAEAEGARARAERALRRLELLQGFSSGLTRAEGVEGIAAAVVGRVRAATGASGSTLRVLAGGRLEVIEEVGAGGIRRYAASVPLDAPLPAAAAAREGRPVFLPSAAELRARFPAAADITEPSGVRAGAALPLVAQDRVLGVLSLVFDEEREFEPGERDFLVSIAEQCAQALDRAQLLDAERTLRLEAQQARDRLARLQAVTAALSGAGTAADVAQVLVSQARDALGASSAVTYVLAPDGRLVLEAAVGWAERVRDRVASLPLDARLPSATAARTGEPLWIEGADRLVAAFPEMVRLAPHAVHLHALVAVPLQVGGRLLGAMSIGFDAPRRFEREDRELILASAQQCAQALDRARLLDAERAARASEERARATLDAIFDNAPLGLALIDRELRFVRVNPSLAGINGVPAAAHVGRTPRELLPELPHDEVEAAFRDVLSTGRPRLDVELSGETPAAPGRLRHWRESWYPVRVGADIVGLGVLVREITDERLADEFQRNVLGVVGHDLRGPLSAIGTAAQLLLREPADPAAVRRLGERIVSNSGRMQRIIAVLLDYARARGGSGIPLHPRPCDLAALCRAVVEECEASRGARAVGAEGPAALPGRWDPDRVCQVVANLLSNALDYSPPDSTVAVTWRAEGGRAIVEVSNEGPSIPPALLPHVFEPFRRGERDRPGGRDGLGLGLFIARTIAIAHGGALEVRSRPGERTTFTLALPLG